MKTGKGIITLLNENRLVDRIARFTYVKGWWRITGYYPIFDKTGKETGRFMCAYGNGPLVRFLSWLTDYRGYDAIKHEVKWQ